MSHSRETIYGISGTIVFHALLILALLFLALRTPLPLPEEQGVEVNLGYTDEGTGTVQPVEEAAAQVSSASSHKSPETQQEIVTQANVETPPLEEVKTPVKTVENKDNKTDDEATTKSDVVKKEEARQPVVNPDALYKGRRNQSETTGSEGQTGRPGDQGVPEGTPGAANYTGAGGLGDGISFSLGGRQARLLPKPEYLSDEQGKVVVTIWVNRNGDVIRAEAGAKGTDITDLSLRKVASEAALRSKFTPDMEAPEEQKGTITYKFIKMN
jgi:outer membrane biosynthesis protein TonB